MTTDYETTTPVGKRRWFRNPGLDALSPLRRSRALYVYERIDPDHGTHVDHDKEGREFWERAGFTLSQRDRALDDLAAAGLILLEHQRDGVWAYREIDPDEEWGVGAGLEGRDE
jgi:hypothetical protein